MIVEGSVVKTTKHQYLMTVESVTQGIARCVYFDKDKNGGWRNLIKEDYAIDELEYIR